MKSSRRDIVGYGLLWLVVVVVVVWAFRSVAEHRRKQPITSFEIVVEHSGGKDLIDAALIEAWLKQNNIHPMGRKMAEVDLGKLEATIAEHSAVSSVNAYMTYDGELHVSVAQRRAVARLRVDGYDMYVAADGYLLPISDGYLLQLPVITGDYKPLFGAEYVGYHGNSSEKLLDDIKRREHDIEERRIELLEKRDQLNAELRRVEKESVKREIFMSDNEYRGRVERLKERKSEARRQHAERDREIEASLRELDNERLKASLEADKVRSAVEDFNRLIAFVMYICDNDFWCAEVTQVVLSGGGESPMQIAIVPRSGDFLVDLGFTDNLVGKLTKLRKFYDSTLQNVGWDRYKHISLRYNNQVVCK